MNLRRLVEDELGLIMDSTYIRIDDKFKNIAKNHNTYCFTFRYDDIEYAARFIGNVVLNQHKLDDVELEDDVLKSEAKHAATKLKQWRIHTSIGRKGYNVAIYYKNQVYQKMTDLSLTDLWCLYDIIKFCFAYRDLNKKI